MVIPKSWEDTAHSNGLIEDNLVKGLYTYVSGELKGTYKREWLFLGEKMREVGEVIVL